MALVTDKPDGMPSGNDLDRVEIVDHTGIPPAYLRFGTSPAALDDPPAIGDVRTYIVLARCTEEHGPIERRDGELRYMRTLVVQACWESGKPPPPATDEAQPALFDSSDDLSEFDPEFSHNTDE